MGKWLEIEQDVERGEVWYGRLLLKSYDVSSRLMHPELDWLRGAIQDVRASLAVPDAQPVVQEIRVYRELKVKKVNRIPSGALGALIRKHWAGVAHRHPRGVVRYGDRIRLYLSEEGAETPLVVYEEVAHCLMRRTALELSGGSLTRQERRCLREYAKALSHSRGLGHGHDQLQWWPVLCHLEIYRGFLNNSKAMSQSREIDIQAARRVVEELGGPRPRCRIESGGQNDRCPC